MNNDLFIREKLAKWGSNTAKGGFKNENDIVAKFNNWRKDKDARKWLKLMNYALKEIERVKAVKIHGYKTDVQIQITIYMKEAISAENLSVKLVSNPQGFNQVDKRRIDRYVELWNIPSGIANALKLFTGEISPDKNIKLKDKRRMLLSEMSIGVRDRILQFLEQIRF